MNYKSKVTDGLDIYENTKPFSRGKTLAELEYLDVHVDFVVFASMGDMDKVVRDVILFLSLRSKKNLFSRYFLRKRGNYRITFTSSSATGAIMIIVECEHNGKRFRNTIALNQAEL